MTMEQEWWRGAVIYQIYPRSFMDDNDDGIGDLKGISAKLAYVASLGVDGIWISPFFTSPMKDFGYDVADYRNVDEIFGNLDDFDELIATAHELNLKVIIDLVYSHSSDQHPWFQESRASRTNPKADWYTWADAKPDGSPPNNWQSIFTGASWTWDARREQYYMHNFLAEQPDLNLHNPAVQEELMNITRFWLDRGVDGFRLDAINHGMHDPELRDNPVADPSVYNTSKPFLMQDPLYTMNHPDMPVFLERIRALTDQHGSIFTVAEVGGSDPLVTQKSYTANGKRLNSAYGFQFLGMQELNTRDVRGTLEQWQGDTGEGWPSWAFSNHDAPRVASRWLAEVAHDRRTRLFALLQMAMRGNIFIYQGEELGLTQAEVPFEQIQDPEALRNWPQTQGRDGARTPMPWSSSGAYAGFSNAETWLPIPDEHVAMAVDQQTDNPDSILSFFREAIGFRKTVEALRLGDQRFVDGPDDLLIIYRSLETSISVCVFNLSDMPVDWMPDEASQIGRLLSVGLENGGTVPEQLPAFSGYIGVIDVG